MPYEKFTDDEIIKALECCKLTDEQHESQCEDCPLWETSVMICQELLAFHALDLINRQKAEIDHFADIGKMYSEVRADAIREFAERLKEKSYIPDPYWKMSVVDEYRIDNLVKEMTEGQI